MVKRKLTAKQIAAGFGGKRRKAAAKGGRRKTKRVRVSTRRAPKRRNNMAGKKKSSRRSGGKTFSVTKTASAIAGMAVVAEPFISRVPSALMHLKNGNFRDPMQLTINAAREATQPGNLIKAAVPVLVGGLVVKGLRTLRVPSPKLGRFRAF